MSSGNPPPRKLRSSDFIGGFGLMLIVFGIYSWVSGRDVPWGYQQTGGAIAAGLGLIVALVSRLLLQSKV
jgi:hypothetical protein